MGHGICAVNSCSISFPSSRFIKSPISLPFVPEQNLSDTDPPIHRNDALSRFPPARIFTSLPSLPHTYTKTPAHPTQSSEKTPSHGTHHNQLSVNIFRLPNSHHHCCSHSQRPCAESDLFTLPSTCLRLHTAAIRTPPFQSNHGFSSAEEGHNGWVMRLRVECCGLFAPGIDIYVSDLSFSVWIEGTSHGTKMVLYKTINRWEEVMSISSEPCSGQTKKVLWNYSFAMLDYRYCHLEILSG